MEIRVVREKFTDNSTTSTVMINGIQECFSLEPPLKPQNGLSCVPFGKYQITLRQDGEVWGWMKVKCPNIGLENGIPHIHNIDGIDYPLWHDTKGILPEQFVLIHVGNFETPKEDDSLGCLCIGKNRDVDSVSGSIAAFDEFYPKLLAVIKAGESVTIEYIDGRQ